VTALDDAVGRGKREIREDHELLIIPSVASFDELARYVDANEYGGLTTTYAACGVRFWAAVQAALDEWLADGGLYRQDP